jgi:hypothetical protein
MRRIAAATTTTEAVELFITLACIFYQGIVVAAVTHSFIRVSVHLPQ